MSFSFTIDELWINLELRSLGLRNEMMSKEFVESAVHYFKDDYLCSQSILMAFASRVGMEIPQAARIAAPFGAGMSRKGWTCGAVSGALMVIGLRFGHEQGTDLENKEKMYQKSQAFMAQFEEKHGTVVCRELLGHDLDQAGALEIIQEEGLFESRCPYFVRDAAEILLEILEPEL